jgi:hypothetical protein
VNNLCKHGRGARCDLCDADLEAYRRLKNEKMRSMAEAFARTGACGLWTDHANRGPWSEWEAETWMFNGSLGDSEETGRERRSRFCLDCGALAEEEFRGAWSPPSGTPDVRRLGHE